MGYLKLSFASLGFGPSSVIVIDRFTLAFVFQILSRTSQLKFVALGAFAARSMIGKGSCLIGQHPQFLHLLMDLPCWAMFTTCFDLWQLNQSLLKHLSSL